MKKVKILIVLILFCNFCNASCVYSDCTVYATSKANMATTNIGLSYDKLISQISSSQDAYKSYKNSLGEQNKLLEKLIKIRRHNALLIKKATFLMNKLILSKDINIDKKMMKSFKVLKDK